MRALLVYPEFPETFWSFTYAMKFIRKRASLPPLGLVTVAAMLPASWEKRLVDMNVRPLTDEDLAWAEVVLIGGMIAQRASAKATVARCAAAGKTIVAGGPLFAAEPDAFPEVDHFVLNEAEVTLAPFLADFEAGRAKRVYASDEFADVRSTPVPLWELLDLRWYASMCVQFSRGCPFDCEFCSVTAMFGRRPRVKTPEQVLAELDGLWRLGWRGSVFFVDDNLIGDKRPLVSGLLPALTKWQRERGGVSLYTQASINLADDEPLMRQMADAGFDTVFVGIETPEEASLAECGKRQNRGRDLVADVKRMQRAGLQVQGGFIVGFDNDSPGVFQRQLAFIQESGIVTAMVGLLNAVPGTKLYRRLAEEGRLVGATSGNNLDGTTNFVPRMDLASLREGYAKLLRRLYAPGPYYRRVRTLLREYRPPTTRTPITWADIRTFVHAGVRLGITGRERFQYWRLVLWTLFTRPGLLHVSVTLAVCGNHYRRVTANMLRGLGSAGGTVAAAARR